MGGEAAEAGDEAVEVALGRRGGEAPDFDGLAEALGRDGGLQLGQGGGVEGQRSRGRACDEDLGEGDVVDCGHWGLLCAQDTGGGGLTHGSCLRAVG